MASEGTVTPISYIYGRKGLSYVDGVPGYPGEVTEGLCPEKVTVIAESCLT